MKKKELTAAEVERLRSLHFNTWSRAGALFSLQVNPVDDYNEYTKELGAKYDFDPKTTTIDLKTGEIKTVKVK